MLFSSTGFENVQTINETLDIYNSPKLNEKIVVAKFLKP